MPERCRAGMLSLVAGAGGTLFSGQEGEKSKSTTVWLLLFEKEVRGGELD